jgi:1,5-anhydro-D-fructose reductase (1,5-anhydro-D-mannitol-forming)
MSSSAPSPEPSPPLRVLVVGFGLIGRQRAAALDGLEGALLAGTVDPLAEDPSAQTGAPHHADLQAVPADLYDAAIIAVPHDRAAELAATVLRAGRPVLVEKPLGMTSEEARALQQLADAVAAPSFVGYNYRFLPAISAVLELASSGALGRLRNLDLLLGHGGHPSSGEGWKLDPQRAGGGVLLDPGVHLLDLLLTIAPAAECTDVQATRGFWPTGIEEDVVATFRHEQLLATVRSSHIRWVNTFRVELVGEDGYALAEGRGGNYGPMTLRVGSRWAWNAPGAGSQREMEDERDFGAENRSLEDELAAVVRAWRGGHAPGPVHPATMVEARAVTELCDRLYRQLA